MNRAFVVLPLAAVLVAAAWPASPAQRVSAPGLCEQMTQPRLLENPTLGNAYADALKSGDPTEIARVQALFERIRAAHGCGGAVATPDPAPSESAPRLPPGHPPISPGQHPPVATQFDGPGIVTI